MSDVLKILYADDDLGEDPQMDRTCMALCRAFERKGRTVSIDVARTGAETYRMLTTPSKTYDALILDIMMPPGEGDAPSQVLDAAFDMVGLVIANLISDKSFPSPPEKVIIYTATADIDFYNEIDEILKKKVAWRLIGKPCLNSDLAKLVLENGDE